MLTSWSFLLAIVLGYPTFLVTSFTATCVPSVKRTARPSSSLDNAVSSGEDDVSRQLAKARELIEKAKAKLDNGEAASNTAAGSESVADVEELPFFAKVEVDSAESTKRREMVTKTKDEATGLITTDGEKLASLAEGEMWEKRSLFEVFENEMAEMEASTAADMRAARDVAAAMMNLRKRMNQADYEAIFDKRNRFIGEE